MASRICPCSEKCDPGAVQFQKDFGYHPRKNPPEIWIHDKKLNSYKRRPATGNQAGPMLGRVRLVGVGIQTTIKCIDCGVSREVKPQDVFQVKRCKPCQLKFKKNRGKASFDKFLASKGKSKGASHDKPSRKPNRVRSSAPRKSVTIPPKISPSRGQSKKVQMLLRGR